MLALPDPVSVMFERDICAAFGLRCAGVMSCLSRLATHTSTASPVRPAPEAAPASQQPGMLKLILAPHKKRSFPVVPSCCCDSRMPWVVDSPHHHHRLLLLETLLSFNVDPRLVRRPPRYHCATTLNSTSGLLAERIFNRTHFMTP